VKNLRLLVLCVLVLLVPRNIFAQTENATITGRITDPAKATIVGAEVSVVNTGTNLRYEGTTNSVGSYVIAGIAPGPYRIEVGKAGFKTIVETGIVLHVQDTLELNFEMALGAVSESVTVTAGATNMNTTDATVSTVVDRKFVENMPLNGRSFQDLISMTPGVVTQNPNNSSSIGFGGDFSVNGQRTSSNIYSVDGVSANVAAGTGFGNLNALAAASGSVPAGTVLGTTQSLVSVDALQEFRVQSSTYSAEYGRAPGGQFSLVTRSGTNDLHGTIFDYFRNDFFDANDWFNNLLGKPISALRQNDFGGTLGGPIRIPRLYNGRDKTFFFFSYEGLRLVQPQAASTSLLVPDTFMRQQAPAALQPILNSFPLPNGKDFGTAAAPSLAQFIHPFSVPSNIDATSVRVDHIFAAKLTLFFRIGYAPSSTEQRGTVGATSGISRASINTTTFTLGALSQLSGRAGNDFRLGYARSDAKQEGSVDAFGGATPVNLAAAMGAGSFAGSSLQMEIDVPGVGSSVIGENTGNNRLRQWNAVDTFSMVLGRHRLKVGADYRRIISPTTPLSPGIIPIYSGAQSVLNNQATVVQTFRTLSATPIFNETAVFVQDEWRVASRLNLSLGLRWEVDPSPHGTNGQDAFTLLGSLSNPSSLTLAPRGTPLWNTSWYNFAPRLGFAWTARNEPGWETVVRAGGGVFFDTNNQVATSGFQGVGFNARANYFGASLPLIPAQLDYTPSVTPPFSSNVYAFPAHLQLPYTLQWNVAIRQALGNKQTITVSYLGAAARRLQGQQFLRFHALNPNFNVIVNYNTGLTSDYDALQAQFQRSISHGVHALASYTWSHCIDSGSSYAALPFIRGNCDTDVRHNLQGGASWDLPDVSGNKFAQALLNHWGLDSRLISRTGFPVTLCGRTIIDPATGSQFCAGLNLVPNQPVYLYGSEFPGGRAVNPAAFMSASGANLGNAPRNFVRGFGAWQLNVAVRREFPIHERLHLQFRAEAFNVLNHPNFGFVDPNITDATFGQATRMLNQSLGTVASQYQQGGPRSMQFALKFLF